MRNEIVKVFQIQYTPPLQQEGFFCFCMSKIEKIYEKLTGIDPRSLEPKPTEEYLQKQVRKISTEEVKKIQEACVEIRVDSDFEGLYTAIIVCCEEEKRVAILDGDVSRTIKVEDIPTTAWILERYQV